MTNEIIEGTCERVDEQDEVLEEFEEVRTPVFLLSDDDIDSDQNAYAVKIMAGIARAVGRQELVAVDCIHKVTGDNATIICVMEVADDEQHRIYTPVAKMFNQNDRTWLDYNPPKTSITLIDDADTLPIPGPLDILEKNES